MRGALCFDEIGGCALQHLPRETPPFSPAVAAGRRGTHAADVPAKILSHPPLLPTGPVASSRRMPAGRCVVWIRGKAMTPPTVSKKQPWKTIGHALGLLKPATRSACAVEFSTAGDGRDLRHTGKPITIRSYPGGTGRHRRRHARVF